jgi:hypothetical protein
MGWGLRFRQGNDVLRLLHLLQSALRQQTLNSFYTIHPLVTIPHDQWTHVQHNLYSNAQYDQRVSIGVMLNGAHSAPVALDDIDLLSGACPTSV